MKIHLQTGPGHHERILIDFLKNQNLDFSYSSYHPKYSFTNWMSRKSDENGSRIYDLVKWMVWGISHKLSILRKRNKHLIITYSLYDYISSKRIDCDLLFGWAQVSKYSIQQVKKRGGLAILDYPIPHILKWQQVLMQESELLNTKKIHSLFSDGMVSRMLKEIALADYISVPSEFVRKSFLEFDVPPEKLIFNSYGVDTDFFVPSSEQNINNDKFVMLFVGSIEIRKGVHYLLEMFDSLKIENVELRLVGTLQADTEEAYARFEHNKKIRWLGQLSKEETRNELQLANIMIMPSLLEGLSLTILEAMACGTPVISTLNAGGLGVIENGVDGFLVPIRDTIAMREKVEWCIGNPAKLKEVGIQARKKVINGYRKIDYGNRFTKLILEKQNERGMG